MKKISSLLFFVFILNASYAQMQPQAEEVRFPELYLTVERPVRWQMSIAGGEEC